MVFCERFDPLFYICDETLHHRPERRASEDEQARLVTAIKRRKPCKPPCASSSDCKKPAREAPPEAPSRSLETSTLAKPWPRLCPTSQNDIW